MTSQSERNAHYHNEGQTDASKGVFNPPHGLDLAVDPFLDNKAAIDENKHYKDGHHNTKSQKK